VVSAAHATAHFRGQIRNQTFGGALDLLEIDYGNSHFIRARIPNPGPLMGQQNFEFDAADAVRLLETSDA
jgi:hypothetical protein